MRLRMLLAGFGLVSGAACNPVDVSRTFDSSRGATRYVLVTRFPMDLQPRVFEQAGVSADMVELEIPNTSGVRVEVSGGQLLVPAAEENVVLEFYDRELAIPEQRTPTLVFSQLLIQRATANSCEEPLCYVPRPCSPARVHLVSSSTAAGLTVSASLFSRCSGI